MLAVSVWEKLLYHYRWRRCDDNINKAPGRRSRLSAFWRYVGRYQPMRFLRLAQPLTPTVALTLTFNLFTATHQHLWSYGRIWRYRNSIITTRTSCLALHIWQPLSMDGTVCVQLIQSRECPLGTPLRLQVPGVSFDTRDNNYDRCDCHRGNPITIFSRTLVNFLLQEAKVWLSRCQRANHVACTNRMHSNFHYASAVISESAALATGVCEERIVLKELQRNYWVLLVNFGARSQPTIIPYSSNIPTNHWVNMIPTPTTPMYPCPMFANILLSVCLLLCARTHHLMQNYRIWSYEIS